MTVSTRAAGQPVHPTPAPDSADGDRRRLWLPVDEATTSTARDHVRSVLVNWGVDGDCIADAILLTSEVVSNIVEHTSVRSIGLDVGATATRVFVDVRESGTTAMPAPDTHVLTDFDPVAAPRPADLHGRGLRILDALSTAWGISRTHRCTSTWFALTPASAPPLSVVSPSAAAELDAVQSSLRRTQLLLRVTENLGRAVTAEQVGDVVTAHLRDHLDAVFTGIALVDAGEDGAAPTTMSYLDLSVFPQATRDRWSRFHLDVDAPVGAVVLTRTASYIENLADAEAEFSGLATHMTTAGTRALAHLPLLAGGRSIGTLALAWGEPREIDADTRALLTIVAGYTAQALLRFGTAAPADPAVAAVIRAERRLVDAHEEFDAAVAAGVPSAGLASRDVEITRAKIALRSARSRGSAAG